MPVNIITTSDGSHSLYNTELDEHYHSVHGAIQESMHVFIQAGLRSLPSIGNINILEIGFGTGLNAFLTFLESRGFPGVISYTAIEPFPLGTDIVSSLNYAALLDADEKHVLEKMHSAEHGAGEKYHERFNFIKVHDRIQDAVLNEHYDLVYFDAFGPRVQPEMWSSDVFWKLHSMMKDGAMLVTYCAKGEVKRTLKGAGFRVETLPGPPGKREMVRAINDR